MIMSSLIALITPLITALPTVSLAGFTTKIDPVWDYFSMLGYVLPLQQLVPLFLIIIAITVIPFVISIIKTIWDMLPVLQEVIYEN